MAIQWRGGLCAEGPCARTVIVERDGQVHEAAKPPNDLGVVDPAALAALETAIGATDFTAVRSHRFTGTCPTAFDGQELVFEFATAQAVERIESCQVEVDWGSPLFVAVTSALGPFVALPAP